MLSKPLAVTCSSPPKSSHSSSQSSHSLSVSPLLLKLAITIVFVSDYSFSPILSPQILSRRRCCLASFAVGDHFSRICFRFIPFHCSRFVSNPFPIRQWHHRASVHPLSVRRRVARTRYTSENVRRDETQRFLPMAGKSSLPFIAFWRNIYFVRREDWGEYNGSQAHT